VTHYAAKLVKRVRDDGMPPKRLYADIGKTGFFQSGVARGAAIYNSELRQPDLLDPGVPIKVALQGYSISSGSYQS
jgi:hypothetical protein